MAEPCVQTSIRLPVGLSKQVEDYCRITGETKTAVIIAALEMYISR